MQRRCRRLSDREDCRECRSGCGHRRPGGGVGGGGDVSGVGGGGGVGGVGGVGGGSGGGSCSDDDDEKESCRWWVEVRRSEWL
jgi:hypothetical protein